MGYTPPSAPEAIQPQALQVRARQPIVTPTAKGTAAWIAAPSGIRGHFVPIQSVIANEPIDSVMAFLNDLNIDTPL
jgi:hypothetical protein